MTQLHLTSNLDVKTDSKGMVCKLAGDGMFTYIIHPELCKQ
jgi:hypothetical protein